MKEVDRRAGDERRGDRSAGPGEGQLRWERRRLTHPNPVVVCSTEICPVLRTHRAEVDVPCGMAVLHVHEFGDPAGEPLLAIHGIGAHGARFRRLAEERFPTRRWVAVDLRGHGRSLSDGPWSLAQHLDDVLDTLDHRQIADGAAGDDLAGVDVVGHSFGGTIALALCTRATVRVRRLVLLDPAVELPGEAASENASRVITDLGWATEHEALVARSRGLGSEIHPSAREEIDAHLVAGEDGRYRFRVHKPAVVTAWGETCHALPDGLPPVPTLLVVAERAGMVSAESQQRLRGLLGHRLTTVHLDCGHMLYWERFDETADAIAAFFDR